MQEKIRNKILYKKQAVTIEYKPKHIFTITGNSITITSNFITITGISFQLHLFLQQFPPGLRLRHI